MSTGDENWAGEGFTLPGPAEIAVPDIKSILNDLRETAGLRRYQGIIDPVYRDGYLAALSDAEEALGAR